MTAPTVAAINLSQAVPGSAPHPEMLERLAAERGCGGLGEVRWHRGR